MNIFFRMCRRIYLILYLSFSWHSSCILIFHLLLSPIFCTECDRNWWMANCVNVSFVCLRWIKTDANSHLQQICYVVLISLLLVYMLYLSRDYSYIVKSIEYSVQTQAKSNDGCLLACTYYGNICIVFVCIHCVD